MLRAGPSPFTNPQPLTSHARASGLPVRFQNLFLAFSPGASRLAFWHFVLPPSREPTARQAVLVPESSC
jgi:hypothetical protein